ncbi:MAG: anti-sigma factor [Acidobacteria bacterium]|nr:anti-sigma factor [Acidobacteriota bacterium]
MRNDDPRGPELQTQIDDLRVALQDWRRTREYSLPTEERLAQITVQCARMVESWQQMEQRRGAAVSGPDERPGDWGAGGSRLEEDSGERIRALERTIEHEWEALGEGHDQPAGQLREQAVSLAESCIAAANLTVRGFARAESRLATLEQDLQGRMTQMSRDLQSVVAELRSARPHPLPVPTPAFPLESVMRIHEELQESDAPAVSGPDAVKAGPTHALPPSTESATALTARVESLERVVGNAAAAPAPSIGAWRPRYAVIGLVAGLAAIALFGLWIQRRVDTRLSDAAARVSAAERQRDATTELTNTRLAATREEAAQQVAAARESAARAQIVGNVLAAPDLLRYWLTGVGANSRAYAQVLLSRSRGMVFSASRLPSPGAGRTYQLWLLTRGGPVSAGLLTPDTAGRVTLATDVVPLSAERRLIGALVTLEPAGGGPQPSADRVLIREPVISPVR